MDWMAEGDSTIALRLAMFQEHKQAVLAQIALMTESLQGIEKKIERYTNYLETNGKEVLS